MGAGEREAQARGQSEWRGRRPPDVERPEDDGRLVGRDHELAIARRALKGLDEGRGGVLVVSGEPGIGKTRLLAEVCRRADRHGHLVVAGRGAEYERDLPFGPFVEALDDNLSSLDASFLERLGWLRLGELAVVFPSMTRFAPKHRPLHADRYRVYRAVRALLAALAESRPVVLALDDLHWADGASTELVIHLLRSPPRGPLLLLLAFRTPTVPAPLAGAVETAAREQAATLLRLAPLSAEEADELMGSAVARSVRAELYSESGGNPFYLEELLRAAVVPPSWQLRRLSGLPEVVPPAVLSALAAELHSLSTSALDLLQAAAMAGDPFEIDLAAEIAGVSEDGAAADLDELLGRDLVRCTEVPRRFRFRHPLLRTAIYESSGPGWRLGAHRRAAAALAARSAPVEVRAHHVQRFAGTGDEDALEVLMQAARTAREPFSAARWYDAALRLLPPGADDDRHIELAIGRTTALGSAGRLSEFDEALHETLEHLPADATEARADLVAFGSCLAIALGQPHEFFPRINNALAGLPEKESPAGVKLQIELGINRLACQEPEQARPLAEAAVVAAGGVGDRALLAGAMAARLVGQCTTDVERAQRDVPEVATAVDALSDDELSRYPDAAVNLAAAELQLERFDEAIEHLRRAICVCRATGQERLLPFAIANEATALVVMGDLATAAELADICVEIGQLSANAHFRTVMLAVDWTLTAAMGDTARAVRVVEASAGLVEALDPRGGVLGAISGSVFAANQLLAGVPERARQTLLRTGGGDDLQGLPSIARPGAYELLAHADLALGRVPEAERWVEEAAASFAPLPLALPQVSACRARAAVLLARGDADGAAELARQAADTAESVRAPIAAAVARLLTGRALARAGRREEGVAELTAAEALFGRCGADGHRRAALADLRRLGRRLPPPSSPVAFEGLTARELEVAELVAEQKTNREIATELFVSEKTVESHLAHIFDKLGVSSRRNVAEAFRSRRP